MGNGVSQIPNVCEAVGRFYKATFVVTITDEGRDVWDVSSSPIGFKQSA